MEHDHTVYPEPSLEQAAGFGFAWGVVVGGCAATICLIGVDVHFTLAGLISALASAAYVSLRIARSLAAKHGGWY